MDAEGTFRILPGFLDWANRRTLASLEALDPAPEQARRWFAHVLAAEELWLARLEERAAVLPVWPDADLEDLSGWIRRNADGFAEYLRAHGSAGPDAEITYTNSRGHSHRTRVRDVLIHVIAHGTYHRGQIAAAVRSAGGTPAVTDYVFYARGEV